MTATHTRSIHIDAPVAKVFDHVKDPHRQYAAFPQEMVVSDEQMTPDMGAGSTWKAHGHTLHIPVSATVTREECITNQRIVDRSDSMYSFSVEPDGEGTTLTIHFEYSSTVPGVDKILDRIAWKGDRDMDTWLGNLKQAIEA